MAPIHEEMIPLEEFATAKGIDSAKVIDMIRDGFYVGRIIDDEWHVSKEELSTDESAKPGMHRSGNSRLGINLEIPNVDSELVPHFTKASRVIGVAMTVMFVWWGLSYEWTYRKSPFEVFVSFFLAGFDDDVALFMLVGVIMIAGWFFRFTLGVSLAALYFWIFDIVKKVFKTI